MAVNTRTMIFVELADFLVEQPDLEAIIEYQLPEAMQDRVHELLDKNREEGLSIDEREEMQHYLAANHFMSVLKSKARLKLGKQA